MEMSIEKRSMHVYIGNVMELFNEIKKQSEQLEEKLEKDKAISVIIKEILIPSLSVVAPETVSKISK